MTQFTINVVINPSGAVAGAKKVERVINRTNVAANKLGATFKRIFGPLLAIAGVIKIVNVLADFEQAISTVGAVSEASATQLQEFTDTARRLGATTRFSATEAAEGLVFLARAGFSANEALGAIEGTLKLAQAGALNLGRAADIASNVLQGFRLEVTETGRVVDVMAKAANSSNTNVLQLGEALSFVAPIAAGVGVSLEETVGAIGALSNAGIQASRAGTGLTRVISNLEAPTNTTKDILRGLGITADQVKVSSVGLTQAIRVLGEAGVDTGLALEIFGQRGGPAFEVLSSSIDDVEALTRVMGGAAGTADELARIMDDNLKGSLKQLVSAFQEVILAAGESGASGALRSMVDGLTGVFRFIGRNIEFFKVGVLSASVVLLTRFIPAVAVGTKGMVGFSVSLEVAKAKVIAFSRALRLTPIGVIAGGLIALGVTIDNTAKKFQTLQETMLGVTEQGIGFAATDFTVASEKMNRAIAELQRSTEENNKTRKAGGEVTAFLAQKEVELTEKVARLTKTVDLFKKGLVKTTAEAEAQIDAMDNLGKSFDAVIEGLKQENVLLRKNSREREIQIRLRDQIKALQDESGTDLTPAQKKELELIIRTNTHMEEQAALMDELTGKRIEFGFQAAALNALRQDGIINLDTFNKKLKELKEELLGVTSATDGAATATKKLDDATNVPKMTAFLFAFQQVANVSLEPFKDAARLMAEMQAPAEQAEQDLISLKIAFDAGTLSAKQYTIAVNNITIAQAAAGGSALDGLKAGFARIENQMLDLSGAIEGTLVNAYNRAEDELASFLSGGANDWSAFADAVLKDISRILIQQALLTAISGGGSLLGLGGARAEGGPVSPSSTFLVGEEGPELFTPPGNGTIIPAAETAAALGGGGQTPVSVTIVNTSDPADTIAAMNSSQGTQLILNVLSQNPTAVKNALQ